ncbi:MAG: galactokinase family protein [Actinomycetota bacterium]
MFQIARGNSQNLKEVAEFISLINDPPPPLRNFFDPEISIFITRAPGRLDVMGGIADYSGSLVLEMPIAEATFAALQKTNERTLKIVSLADVENLIFEMPLDDFKTFDKPLEYETARQIFAQTAENHWAAYVAGVFPVLMLERGIDFQNGARILISSKIPLGKGVSSSAALEVAAMQAVCAAFEINLTAKETALLCQKTENLIVGAPCGVMDQMTSVCGEENRLISLLCQPAQLQETFEIPSEIAFWGIDSGVRHAVVGADYASVRIGAFMGYRMIAELAGLKFAQIDEGFVKIEDSRWNGYLSNVSPSEFEQFFAAQLPEKISGAEFLKKYQGTTDTITKINPEKIYAVKIPAAHAIYENFRVRTFGELLKSPINERKLELLGELMFGSHASYAACGLTEAGTNLLVKLVRETGAKRLYGARITGGGSGGTVAVIGRRGSDSMISEIAARYAAETGFKPFIFQGSSAGSFSFGYLRLEKN